MAVFFMSLRTCASRTSVSVLLQPKPFSLSGLVKRARDRAPSPLTKFSLDQMPVSRVSSNYWQEKLDQTR